MNIENMLGWMALVSSVFALTAIALAVSIGLASFFKRSPVMGWRSFLVVALSATAGIMILSPLALHALLRR